MPSPSIRRSIGLFLLALAVTAPPVMGAGQLTPGHQPSAAAAVSPLEIIDHLWRFLTNVWSEEGCRMDPNGHCVAQVPAPPGAASGQMDEGCMMDPDGRCKGN